jgi:hypothetical protein
MRFAETTTGLEQVIEPTLTVAPAVKPLPEILMVGVVNRPPEDGETPVNLNVVISET